MFHQRIVRIERVADLKGVDRERVDAAFCEILADTFRFGMVFELIIDNKRRRSG